MTWSEYWGLDLTKAEKKYLWTHCRPNEAELLAAEHAVKAWEAYCADVGNGDLMMEYDYCKRHERMCRTAAARACLGREA